MNSPLLELSCPIFVSILQSGISYIFTAMLTFSLWWPCRWRRLLLNMIQEWFSQTFHFLKFLFVCFFTVAAALLLRLSQWFDTSMHFKEAHSIWALAILFVLFVTAWILWVIKKKVNCNTIFIFQPFRWNHLLGLMVKKMGTCKRRRRRVPCRPSGGCSPTRWSPGWAPLTSPWSRLWSARRGGDQDEDDADYRSPRSWLSRRARASAVLFRAFIRLCPHWGDKVHLNVSSVPVE